MELTNNCLLPYEGFHCTQGVCHVRVYEQAGRLPVVIAGQLDDGPGTTTTNAIEMVASAIQSEFFSHGREFELVEHWPDTIDSQGTPVFARVHFEHRSIQEDPGDASHFAGTLVSIDADGTQVDHGSLIEGDFGDARWEPIQDISDLVGCAVQVWHPGDYTAGAVAGDAGQQLRDEGAEQSKEAINHLIAFIEPDS
jgi:hypothetical protein